MSESPRYAIPARIHRVEETIQLLIDRATMEGPITGSATIQADS